MSTLLVPGPCHPTTHAPPITKSQVESVPTTFSGRSTTRATVTQLSKCTDGITSRTLSYSCRTPASPPRSSVLLVLHEHVPSVHSVSVSALCSHLYLYSAICPRVAAPRVRRLARRSLPRPARHAVLGCLLTQRRQSCTPDGRSSRNRRCARGLRRGVTGGRAVRFAQVVCRQCRRHSSVRFHWANPKRDRPPLVALGRSKGQSDAEASQTRCRRSCAQSRP